MKTSFITESVLYWTAKGGSALFCRLPVSWGIRFGSWAGGCAYQLLPGRRAVALKNLRAAFGEGLTPRDERQILKRQFQHWGMTLLEVFMFPRMNRAYVEKWISFSPGSLTRVEKALSHGRGVIFLTAHFGNWELAGVLAPRFGHPMLVLVREQGWPRLNRLLNLYRELYGNRVIGKGFPIRDLIRGLNEGRIVGIVADQDGGSHGVLSPFFGRLASTAPGSVALSLKTDAPLLPIFVIRKEGAKNIVCVEEPIALPREGSLEDRIRAGIAGYLAVVERYIRKYPHQWLWLHRRWKSSPERRVLILSDGKAGHLTQSKAFAQRLEETWKILARADHRLSTLPKDLVRVEVAQIHFRHPIFRALVNGLASIVPKRFLWGDFWLRLCLTPDSYRRIGSQYADVSISCGAATAGVNLLWGWGIRARTVHITRSNFPSWRRFDLAVIPEHDLPAHLIASQKVGGPSPGTPRNLLVTQGAMALRFCADPVRLARWSEELNVRGSRRIGLLLGGPIPGMPLGLKEVEMMLSSLLEQCERLDAELLVTSSRRTPLAVEDYVRRALGNHPRCRLLALVNRNERGALSSTREAVECIFGLAHLLIVSGDSISMVSEALMTGKRVIGILPQTNGQRRHTSSKQRRFLESLADKGQILSATPSSVGDAVFEAQRSSPQSLGLSVSASGPKDPVAEFLTKWL